MLRTAYHDFIAFVQEAFHLPQRKSQKIKGMGGAAGKNNLFGTFRAKKGGRRYPGFLEFFGCLVRSEMNGAMKVRTEGGGEFVPLGNNLDRTQRCGRIVQIHKRFAIYFLLQLGEA